MFNNFGEFIYVFLCITPYFINSASSSPGIIENTLFCSPNFKLVWNPTKLYNVFFAGQITGVEGYVESIASGLFAGINAVKELKQEEKIIFPKETVIGALTNYVSSPNEKFQPMNANFGILPPLEEKVKDKKKRYEKMAERSLNKIIQ